MPRPTFHNLPEEKRNRIEEAAISEFSERSYDEASISRIVAQADIAKGSFYQYFDGKIDLYRWLLAHVVTEHKLQAVRRETPPEGAGFWTTLEAMALAGLRFGLANPRLVRVGRALWQEGASDDLRKLRMEWHAASRASMAEVLRQGRARGEVREDIELDAAAELVAVIFQHGIDHLLMARIGADFLELSERPDLVAEYGLDAQRALIRDVVSFLRAGLGTPGPGTPGNGPAIDVGYVPGLFGQGP